MGATPSSSAKEPAPEPTAAAPPAPEAVGAATGVLISSEIRRTLPVVCVWATFSFGLSYYNSWVLGKRRNVFPFPLFYTMWHLIVQGCATSIVFLSKPSWPRPSVEQFKSQWKMIIVYAMACVGAIGAENVALVTVSLTVHEALKSAVPVLTMILAFLLEGRFYRPTLIVAVIALATCAVLVTTGAIEGGAVTTAPLGLILSLVAISFASLRPVAVALLTRDKTEGGGPLASTPLMLVWYESLVSTPFFLCGWLLSDERTMMPPFASTHGVGHAIGYIAAGCAMAFFYAIAVNELIHVTSSLTSTVLGTAKHVLMAVIASLFVDRVFAREGAARWQNILCFVGILGFLPSAVFYSYLQLTHQALEQRSYKSVMRRSFCFDFGWLWGGGGSSAESSAGATEASALLETRRTAMERERSLLGP